MPRWSVGAVCIAFLASCCPVRAADPSKSNARVLALIEALGAADYREREKAQRELVSLGQAARPLMKQAAATTDSPEVERRLEVMLARFDREEFLQPKRVTFHGLKSIPELLKVLGDQTGYKLDGEPSDTKQNLKVDWKDKPFWEALDDVCNAAGLAVQIYNDGTGSTPINVSSNNTFDPLVSYFGPFRVVATNISAGQNLQLSGLTRKGLPVPRQHSLNMNLQLFSEPKNPMLGIQPIVLTKAVDDAGTNLLLAEDATQRTSYYPYSAYRINNQYLALNLGKPDRNATVIKELRGKMTVTLLSSTRPDVTVEKLPTVKNKSFVSRTTELHIESVTEPTDAGFSVNLTAKYLHAMNEDYTWANSVYQRLEAYDEKGEKFVASGATNQVQMPGSVALTVPFASPPGKKLGKPDRLVLVEFLTTPREVEFVFKNVPLP